MQLAERRALPWQVPLGSSKMPGDLCAKVLVPGGLFNTGRRLFGTLPQGSAFTVLRLGLFKRLGFAVFDP
jgi:hypothetical protein